MQIPCHISSVREYNKLVQYVDVGLQQENNGTIDIRGFPGTEVGSRHKTKLHHQPHI